MAPCDGAIRRVGIPPLMILPQHGMTNMSIFNIGDRVTPMDWPFANDADCPVVREIDGDKYRLTFTVVPDEIDMSDFGGVAINDFWFDVDEIQLIERA